MNRQRRLLFFLSVVVAISSAVMTWRVSGNTVQGQAFNVVLVETRKSSAAPIVRNLEIAYRSDGSNVTVYQYAAPDGKLMERRRILDVPRQERITVDTMTESTSTFHIPKNVSFRKLGTECTRDPKAPRSMRMGYEVVLTVHDDQPTLRTEYWQAPALRCVVLESRKLRGEPGKLETVLVRKAERITLGEPQARLFEKPSGYVERSPAQLVAEMEIRYGLEPTEWDPDSIGESKYWSTR